MTPSAARRVAARAARCCQAGTGSPMRCSTTFSAMCERHLFVAVELHRVARAALRVGAQVADVAEHLAQRDVRGHDDRVAAALLALDVPAAAHEVADDVADVVLRRRDLDGEDRLHEHGLRAAGGLLERQRAGDLEGDLRGVRVVVLAVDERDLDVDHRVAGLDAGPERLLDALGDGGDELARHGAALDLRDELEALAGVRLDVDVDDAELARAAGLLDEAALDLVRRAADRLAVGDLRAPDVRLDAVLALHAVDEDLEVQLAHAGDLDLAGLLVGLHLEGRVLLGQAAEGDGHLLLVDLRLGLDGDLDDGLGEVDVLQAHGALGRRQRVARRDLLDADRGRDVARVDRVDLLAVVRVHDEQAADALGAPGRDVQDLRAGVQRAGVDAEVRELADERVGHDLEAERRERLGVVGLQDDLVAEVAALEHQVAVDRLDLQRRGQVVEHGVQQRLHALVLEGRAAQDRRDLDRQRVLADRGLEHRDGDLGLVEEQLGDVVVHVGELREQVLARLGGGVGEVRRDLDDVLVLAEVVQVDDRLHLDEVDDALELRLGADRDLQRHGVRAEALLHRRARSRRSPRRCGPSC